jgi:hypothetical protein
MIPTVMARLLAAWVFMNTGTLHRINNIQGTWGFDDGIQLLSIPENLVTTDAGTAVKSNCENGFASIYPNPFNESVNMQFNISGNASVSMNIHNMTGQVVYQVPAKSYGPGQYAFTWNGTNGNGFSLPGGMYMATLKVITPAGIQSDSRILYFLR